MIQPPQHFVDFFTSPLVYYIAIASLCTSLILAAAGGFDLEVPAREAQVNANALVEAPSEEGEKFEIIVCGYYYGPNTFDVLEGIGGIAYSFLILPSLIVANIAFSAIHSLFPSTMSPLGVGVLAIVFFFYNSYYWISLAYATSSIHYNFVKETKQEMPLSIIEGR